MSILAYHLKGKEKIKGYVLDLTKQAYIPGEKIIRIVQAISLDILTM